MATPAVVIVVELQTLPAFTASASPVMMSIASWVDAILEADDDPASCEGLAHKLGATGAVPVFAAALTAAFAEARAGCPTGGHLDAAIDVPRPTYLIRFLRKIAGGCPCVAVQVMRATASVADAFYTPHPPPGGGGGVCRGGICQPRGTDQQGHSAAAVGRVRRLFGAPRSAVGG